MGWPCRGTQVQREGDGSHPGPQPVSAGPEPGWARDPDLEPCELHRASDKGEKPLSTW